MKNIFNSFSLEDFSKFRSILHANQMFNAQYRDTLREIDEAYDNIDKYCEGELRYFFNIIRFTNNYVVLIKGDYREGQFPITIRTKTIFTPENKKLVVVHDEHDISYDYIFCYKYGDKIPYLYIYADSKQVSNDYLAELERYIALNYYNFYIPDYPDLYNDWDW